MVNHNYHEENAASKKTAENISDILLSGSDTDHRVTHNTEKTEYMENGRSYPCLPDIDEPRYDDGSPVFAGPSIGDLSSYASCDYSTSYADMCDPDLDDIDFPFMGSLYDPDPVSMPAVMSAEKKDDRVFPKGHDTDDVLSRFLEDVLGVHCCYYDAAPGDSMRPAPRKASSKKKSKTERNRKADMENRHMVAMSLSCHMRSYAPDGTQQETVYPIAKIRPKRKETETAAAAFSRVSLDMKDSYLDLRLYERKKGAGKPLKDYRPRMCFTLAVDLDDVPGLAEADADAARLALLYDLFPVLRGSLCPTYIVYTGQGGVLLLYCFRQNIMSSRRRKAFLKIQKSLTKAFGGDASYVGTGYIRMPGTARSPKKDGGVCEAPYILLKGPAGTMNWSSFCAAASAFLIEKGVIRTPIKHVDPSGDVKRKKSAPGGVFNPYDLTDDKDIEDTRAYLSQNGCDTAFFYTGNSVLHYEGDPGDIPVYGKRAEAMRRAECYGKPSYEAVMARKLAVRDWAMNRLDDLRAIAPRYGGRFDDAQKSAVIRAFAAVIVNRGLTDQTGESTYIYRDSLLPNVVKQAQDLNSLFPEPLDDSTVKGIVDSVFDEYDVHTDVNLEGYCHIIGDVALAEMLGLSEEETAGLKNRYTEEEKRKHHSKMTMARRDMNRTHKPGKKGRPSHAACDTSCVVKAFFATRRGKGSHRPRIISYMIKTLGVARSTAYRVVKALEKLLAALNAVVSREHGTARKALTTAAARAFAKACPDSGMGFKTLLKDNGNGIYLTVLDFATGGAREPGWINSPRFQRIKKMLDSDMTEEMPVFAERYIEAANYILSLYRRIRDGLLLNRGYGEDVCDAGTRAIRDSMLPDDDERDDWRFDWDTDPSGSTGCDTGYVLFD